MAKVMTKNLSKVILNLLVVLILSANALGWSSKTHIFIAQEAGIKDPKAACFPDLAKRDNDTLLGPFHWHDASPNTIVTPDYIDRYQITEGQYIKVGSQDDLPPENWSTC